MKVGKNESETLTAVEPARPVAPWQGGKRALAGRLSDLIASVPHARYIEPFVGMGGVFFRRDRKPKLEVINDINRDVVNLFRLLQRHYQQLLDTLKWQLCSRADFQRLVQVDPETLTDLERAARFLYLQRTSFGGKVKGQAFGVDYANGARFDLTKLVPLLEDAHTRLTGVVIECLPYAECIARYDSRPGSLFYLDPPYWGCTDDYGRNIFRHEDFTRLRDLLKALQGRFILSINDVPQIRDLFAGFVIEEARLHYGIGAGQRPARELIIRNWETDACAP